MKTVYRIIDRIRTIAIISILGFIIGIGAIQIFLRYFPWTKPFDWVDEIMRYLNIWVVFLAASIGVKESTHLNMDYFLHKFFPDSIVKRIKSITHICIILCMGLLIYHGTLRVWENRNALIQSVPISISCFYLAIPIGSGLILLDYLLILFNKGEHPYARNNL